MDIGLLLLVNLSTIPFLAELENIGSQQQKTPSVMQVCRLAHFRKQRWALGFAIFWLLFLALTVTPGSSGKSHSVSFGLAAQIVILQIAIWGYAIWRLRSIHKK